MATEPPRASEGRGAAGPATAMELKRERKRPAAPASIPREKGGMQALGRAGRRFDLGNRQPTAGSAAGGLPVHALELLLEGVVEELVPVQPEKPEQRPHAVQALHDQLLPLRQLHRRLPTIHVLTSRRARDHSTVNLSIPWHANDRNHCD